MYAARQPKTDAVVHMPDSSIVSAMFTGSGPLSTTEKVTRFRGTTQSEGRCLATELVRQGGKDLITVLEFVLDMT